MMKNYTMTIGRKRNDRIKLIKKIVLFTLIFWGIVCLFKYLDNRDNKLMEINYCYDYNGEHYISPDSNCR